MYVHKKKVLFMMKTRFLRVACWFRGKDELVGFMLRHEHGPNLN
jgi:hypothetical protein